MAVVADCFANCTELYCMEQELSTEKLWMPWQMFNASYFGYHPWLFSLIGSAMVGLSGVFPLLVIPIDEVADLKHGDGAKTLKILLSFAVGGLLGDVFLHLLPEAWANYTAKIIELNNNANPISIGCGIWVLSGFLIFVIAEKLFSIETILKDDNGNDKNNELISTVHLFKKSNEQQHDNNNCSLSKEFHDSLKVTRNTFSNIELIKGNSFIKNQLNQQKDQSNYGSDKNCSGFANSFIKSNIVKCTLNDYCDIRDISKKRDDQTECKKLKMTQVTDRSKHISGYLNLIANSVDNFTHGLAIGGSFLVSFRLGALTTFAILVHEIPHEIGDFAILLRSGFNRWNAAKAQLITATGGMFGAFVAVIFSGDAVESKTNWILPFTAGGFLHIGMVTVLPELLKETNPWESLKQICALLIGIIVMAFLTIMCD